MMKQKLWDKYEAALLLKYALKVDRRELDRKEAITFVSETLRRRAKLQGEQIDDVFRNTNGISMQMMAILDCYHKIGRWGNVSYLFNEVIECYRKDPNSLDVILNEDETLKRIYVVL